ncbi:adenine permease [Candidatus Magnetoovum chiemensis]|nr:adenine permease [Candidatus Magnetoovum chiemensis]
MLAGLTTFLTMAYIMFVQPAVLSKDFAGNPTGLTSDAVLLATCVVSALSCIFMGLYARYPISLAPGMGENFFFISVIMSLGALGFPSPWQSALGVVFISGVLFFIISILNIRAIIIDAISPSLRAAIAGGIGLFIAFIGLKNGAIINAKVGTLIGLTDKLFTADAVVCFTGLIVAASLWVRKVKGALLWGILAAAVLAFALGKISFNGIFGLPDISSHAVFKADIRSALSVECVPFITIFLFMIIFDTTGTLLAVGQQGGFMKDGVIPRANRVFVVDSIGIVAGALFGTSTITAYIESITGIAYGGRTGLTTITTGILFLLALFFTPLIAMIASYPPITSSALIIVGSMMMVSAAQVRWDDFSEGVPSFLIMIGIPLSFSIADGIAIGFLVYPLIKILSGQARQVHKAMYVISALLYMYFIFVR